MARRNVRPLDGLLRDGNVAPVTPSFPASPRDESRPSVAVARILRRTCDEAHWDVSLPGRAGIIRIPHIGRRAGLLVVVTTVDLRGTVKASDDEVWSRSARGRAFEFLNPVAEARRLALLVEDAIHGRTRIRYLVAFVGKPGFDGRVPDGLVPLEDLERHVVELSDGCQGAIDAQDAMLFVRDLVGRRRSMAAVPGGAGGSVPA